MTLTQMLALVAFFEFIVIIFCAITIHGLVDRVQYYSDSLLKIRDQLRTFKP